jgi:uncharacterized protein
MRAFGTLGIIGLIGVVLGAVNWGLIGLFDYNLVEEIVGVGNAADVVYVIVGITGILALGAVVWAFGVITRGGAGSILALLGAVAVVIAVIGAINWGLVGLFDYNLVEAVFGTGSAADAVYIIVGVAGLLTIPTLIGAWGFRSGERRLETSSDALELQRGLDEGRRRDDELARDLEDARSRDEELMAALDDSRRRDEEFAHALDEGRRRDDELSRRIEQLATGDGGRLAPAGAVRAGEESDGGDVARMEEPPVEREVYAGERYETDERYEPVPETVREESVEPFHEEPVYSGEASRRDAGLEEDLDRQVRPEGESARERPYRDERPASDLDGERDDTRIDEGLADEDAERRRRDAA